LLNMSSRFSQKAMLETLVLPQLFDKINICTFGVKQT
jgi:hypothetical protein